MRKVTLSARVKLNQLYDGLLIEQPSCGRPLGKKNFAQERLHRAAEPVTNGDAKTHFASVQVLAGQQLPQHTLQEILGGQASQLKILRQTGGELYDVVV